MAPSLAYSQHTAHHHMFGEDSSDCISSPLFSHDSDTTILTLNPWYYNIASSPDTGPLRRSQHLVEARHEEIFADGRDLCLSPPSTEFLLKQSPPLFDIYDAIPMGEDLSPEHGARRPLPTLLPLSHDGLFRAQPPSPPLDTPELVQRSLPALSEPVSPPLNSPMCMQDLPEADDVEMGDASGCHIAQPSSSRLCERSPTEEVFFPYKRHCGWRATLPSQDVPSSSYSASTSNFHQPELLTPETPMSWMPEPPSPFPDEHEESIDDYTFGISDWESSSSSFSDELPRSSKHRSRSLDLPAANGFRTPSPSGFNFLQPVRGYTSPGHMISTHRDGDLGPLWTMDVHNTTAPHSPRPHSALLPDDDFSSDDFSEERIPLAVDPPPPPGALALNRQGSLSLTDLFDGDLLLSPSSPRAFTTRLPEMEIEEDHLEPPSSPHSPYRELLPMDEDAFVPPSTISPSLLGPPQSSEGLGLFIQPSSIDPPLARSPSPDEDDLQFLDIQLDPASTHLQLDEFLQLRALRRRHLDAERDARSCEAELAERVSLATNALLPSNATSDPAEKHARKHEMHVAMEMRAEAKRTRKREKQRSKEIGALLDLKMERNVLQGKSVMRSVAQLVANMVLKRRDVYRPLASRKPASAVPLPTQSPLRASVSVEDLLEDDAQ